MANAIAPKLQNRREALSGERTLLELVQSIGEITSNDEEVVATVIDRLGPANVLAAKRLGAPRIPIPFSPPLEDQVRVTTGKIIAAAKAAVAS